MPLPKKLERVAAHDSLDQATGVLKRYARVQTEDVLPISFGQVSN